MLALSVSPLLQSNLIDHKSYAVAVLSRLLKKRYGDDTINIIIPDGNTMQFYTRELQACFCIIVCQLKGRYESLFFPFCKQKWYEQYKHHPDLI